MLKADDAGDFVRLKERWLGDVDDDEARELS